MHVGVGDKALNVAWVLRVEDERAGGEGQPILVEHRSVTGIERHQNHIGKLRIDRVDVGAHALKGGVVAHRLSIQIDAINMKVLVAVVVLKIEDRPIVAGPEKAADPPLLIGSHSNRILLPDGLDPDLKDILRVRRDPPEACPVGREPWTGPLRIAEQDLARDERRQLGQKRSGGYREEYEGKRNDEGQAFHDVLLA